VWLVAVVWGPLVLVGPWIGLLYLWHLGRRADVAALAWLRSTKDEAAETGALVTADAIVRALQHLNIPAMTRAFKDGWMPRFELTPTREGQGVFKGYRAIFDLPLGVTPDMVADKGDVLATNLHRNAVEVWPSDYGKEKGGKPGYVNMYVADAGVMDKPTPEYPLMHTGIGDVFAGVPVGITQRGDVIKFVLFGGNFVFGGQPGQGKSNAARVVMAGAALDPICELRVHVFAGNGDFDAYAKRLSRYHKGATPEHAAIATEHLRELFDEVERRENRLAELGAKKLTRALAEQHRDMRPIVAMFSECHELFGDKDCGEEAAELAIRVVKRGRKTGVITGYDTQSSRTDAIPSQLVENVGINGCFAVKTWRSNDGFLGDGSFAAGIRATELRFNVDRGTMVATGVSDELFEIVRTFFIEVNDDTGWDAAADIIDRAMAQLARGTAVSGDRPAPQLEAARDLLDDLNEVLDADPVPAGEVIGALRTLAPAWRPYKDLTVPKLVAALAEYGIKVPATKNKYPVDPITVRQAVARRSTAGLDEPT
jgi:S-DNA-T family DNA segregation ATPase FtsK/SpoIIIE